MDTKMISKGERYNHYSGVNLFIYIFLLGLSCLCLLLESPSTCFLYPHCGTTDSYIFQYIGRCWAMGGLPYRDTFEHKGPFIFLFDAVGFWITGNRFGILVVQAIFLGASLIVVYKIGLMKLQAWKAIILVFLYLLGFAWFSSEGNLTEEYSLFFLLCSFYFVVRYYEEGKAAHNPHWAMIYGLCFGALLMLRVNNAILLVGFCFGIMLELCKEKLWINLFQNILYGICGILIIVVPFSIYFWYYDAIYDMWFGTVLYNYKYAAYSGSNWWTKDTMKWFFQYSAIAWGAGIIALLYAHKRITFSIGCLTGISVSLITLYFSRPYKHYYMLLITLLPIISYMVLSLKKMKIMGIAIAMLLIGQLLYISVPKITQDMDGAIQTIRARGEEGPLASSFQEYEDIASYIPEKDQQYIAGYNIPAYFWLETGLESCYSFFALQDSYGSYDVKIYDEISEQFTSGKARWLLVSGDIQNEVVEKYILDNYRMTMETESIVLYKRRW